MNALWVRGRKKKNVRNIFENTLMWRLKQLEPLLVLESPFKDLGGSSNKAGKDHVRWKISGYKFTFAWL